jgi:hypothetical protein
MGNSNNKNKKKGTKSEQEIKVPSKEEIREPSKSEKIIVVKQHEDINVKIHLKEESPKIQKVNEPSEEAQIQKKEDTKTPIEPVKETPQENCPVPEGELKADVIHQPVNVQEEVQQVPKIQPCEHKVTHTDNTEEVHVPKVEEIEVVSKEEVVPVQVEVHAVPEEEAQQLKEEETNVVVATEGHSLQTNEISAPLEDVQQLPQESVNVPEEKIDQPIIKESDEVHKMPEDTANENIETVENHEAPAIKEEIIVVNQDEVIEIQQPHEKATHDIEPNFMQENEEVTKDDDTKVNHDQTVENTQEEVWEKEEQINQVTEAEPVKCESNECVIEEETKKAEEVETDKHNENQVIIENKEASGAQLCQNEAENCEKTEQTDENLPVECEEAHVPKTDLIEEAEVTLQTIPELTFKKSEGNMELINCSEPSIQE